MYKREEAVSPVIGVILMVAITVILAAVIAAFVFGMAGNVDKTKQVALVAQASQSNPANIEITNHGGRDILSVVAFNITVDGAADPTGSPATIWLTNQTGSVGIYGGNTNAKNRVVVTATYNDGSKGVVIDTTV